MNEIDELSAALLARKARQRGPGWQAKPRTNGGWGRVVEAFRTMPSLKAAQESIEHARNVYDGKADPMDVEKAFGMAGMASAGAVGGVAPAGALTAGAARRSAPKADVANALEPKFPQYAERYPEVGPPVRAVDKKTGKEFDAKQLTPEAEAFMGERQRIAKDMEANGFDPYFDPAQRFDADPSHYPAAVDTMAITAKKPETIAKHEGISMAPAAMKRIEDAYLAGKDIGGFDRWYQMGQLEKEFIKEFGEEAGRAAFKRRFADSMAATTGGADPTGNLLSATYGNYLDAHGLPYPTAAHEMPAPIGGRYITGNLEQHKKVFRDGQELGAGNPKRYNFSANFAGHQDRATMDEVMSGLIDPKMAMPPAGNYGSYEKPVHELAKKHDVSPRELQEVAWGGAKATSDKKSKSARNVSRPMIQIVNESIERTHRLTGMPREEIVRRGLVRGEIPMYARGLPGLAEALEDER